MTEEPVIINITESKKEIEKITIYRKLLKMNFYPNPAQLGFKYTLIKTKNRL